MSRRTFFDSNKAADVVVVMPLISNLSATTNPTSANDTSQGYEAGSQWVNTSLGITFTCVSAAAGAAVWNQDGIQGGSDSFTNLTVTGSETLAGTLSISHTTLAAAGATQGNATLITSRKVNVTASVSTEGVKLPVWATGLEVDVINVGTARKFKVWPNVNAKVSTGASNAADATLLPAMKDVVYKAVLTNTWMAFRSA